jgi:hypothetical protein
MSISRISDKDVAFIREAAAYLEAPSYLMKLADAIGEPLQKVADRVVPDRVADLGNKALRGAMSRAAKTIFTISADGDLEQAHRASGWTQGERTRNRKWFAHKELRHTRYCGSISASPWWITTYGF